MAGTLDKWDSPTLKITHLLLVLFVFIIARFIFLGFFFSGFTDSFPWIYSHLKNSGISFGLLQYVPYHAWSPFFAAFANPLFAAGVLIVSLPFIGKLGKISWETVENYKWVKILTFLPAAILAWELSTYDFNYYLNTPQYIDRILLIVFALLILRNPIYVLPFLALSFLYRSQCNYPIGGFPLFDKQLLFDLLIFVYAYILAKAYVANFKVNLLLLLVCIVVSNYFASGLAKIIHSPHGYEWLVHNKIMYLFMNVHQCGWLRSFAPTSIESMKDFLEKYAVVLRPLILFTELSAILILWRRKAAIVLLAACSIMHIGIFIFGSMFFWKWMAIDLAIIYIFLKMNKEQQDSFFNKSHLKISLLLVITSFIWLRPLSVFWFDTPCNQFFTYEVTDEKGNIYHLERNSMNPYHQFFQYDKFLYLVNKNSLPIPPFGYLGKFKNAHRIEECGASGLPDLEATIGKNYYDTVKIKEYDDFIRTYFTNRNKRNGPMWFTYLGAPYHLYNYESTPVYTGYEKIKKFRAIYNLTYYDGRQVVCVAKKVAREVEIP